MIDRLRSLFRNRFHSGESKRPDGRSWTSIGQSVGSAVAGLLQRLLESRFLTVILSPLSRLIGTERIQRHRGLAMELAQRLHEGRIGLGMQLYIGIGGAVAITLSASLVAWFSFNQVGDAQNRVNEDSIPEMTAAFGVARQAGTLVAAAPRLVTAANSGRLHRSRRGGCQGTDGFRDTPSSPGPPGGSRRKSLTRSRPWK